MTRYRPATMLVLDVLSDQVPQISSNAEIIGSLSVRPNFGN